MVLPLSEWVLSLQSNLLGNFFTDTPRVYFHGYCQYRPHQWERADVQGMLHDSSSMKCLEQTNSYNRGWIDSKFSLGGWLERWTITGSCHNWVQSFFYGKWKCSGIRLWCSPVEYSKDFYQLTSLNGQLCGLYILSWKRFWKNVRLLGAFRSSSFITCRLKTELLLTANLFQWGH